jgi:hypothetical protein
MGYAGGTFPGKKAVLCKTSTVVVGHVCAFEGMKQSIDIIL